MIDWLQSADAALFHFINLSLRNPLFDKLMPLASDMPGFVPVLILVIAVLICKGGARGRVFAVMLLMGVLVGDVLIADSLKHAVARPRPFTVFPDAHVLVGRTDSFSMPSSHAWNWFSGAAIAFFYYRRSIYYMLPLAAVVGFSRVYNGVHYPGDVLAGAILGAGCATALVWASNTLWQWAGRRWFPIWHARLPSLLQPELKRPQSTTPDSPIAISRQWVNLGYALTGLLLLAGLAYLASGRIELSEDEAYQWIWSKHPALSYYSKPLLIACAQFIGTHIWGDNEFGVRFFSPIIAALVSILLLRFLRREASGRVAFRVVLILAVTPLTALGSVLMTVDPLSVLFWTAAMISGWRAVQEDGTTRQWLWTGLWMGLGFLSKPTNFFQIVCWAVFFALYPAARRQLRRAGPWLSLAVALFCSWPFWVWNAQNNWITFQHVYSDSQMSQTWKRTFTFDFLLGEAGVLNPIFFIGALWAAAAFWRDGRKKPFQLFLFSMGAPLVLVYFLLSFHSRVELNWIAPAVVPLFCLMAIYWDSRWSGARRFFKSLFGAGIGVGAIAVVILHDSNLLTKILHRAPPPDFDPLRRVEGWKETAAIVGRARSEMEKRDGRPTFIICDHYGLTSEITFYLPDAKKRVSTDPFVFFRAEPKPENEFFYWPSYLSRTGQDALFVVEAPRPKLRPDWLSRWWNQTGDIHLPAAPSEIAVPRELRLQFESVTSLGVRDVAVAGKGVLRRVELLDCHNLLPHEPSSR